jgi:hypothetical protein
MQVSGRCGVSPGELLDKVRARVAFSPTGCWIWQMTKNSRGYAQMGVRRPDGSGTVSKSVHRLVAAAVYGPIPAGALVCHHCDVRDCVNPAHLYIGTARDNARDMVTRGRAVNKLATRNASKTHCANGHPYSTENTKVRPNGERVCRTCQRISWRKSSAKRRAEHQAGEVAA